MCTVLLWAVQAGEQSRACPDPSLTNVAAAQQPEGRGTPLEEEENSGLWALFPELRCPGRCGALGNPLSAGGNRGGGGWGLVFR